MLVENNNKGKIDKMKKGLELFKIRENNSLPNFSLLEENGIHSVVVSVFTDKWSTVVSEDTDNNRSLNKRHPIYSLNQRKANKSQIKY